MDQITVATWLGVVITTISVVATIIIYFRNRSIKRLVCIIDPASSIVEIKPGVSVLGDLELRLDGRSIKNLFAVTAKLKNAGNVAIRNTDLVTPITFIFAEDVEILRLPRIVKAKPANVEAIWSFPYRNSPKNIVHMSFELLNKEDEIVTEFICTGNSDLPKVQARIVDIQSIEFFSPESYAENWRNSFLKRGLISRTLLYVNMIAVVVITASLLGKFLNSEALIPFFGGVITALVIGFIYTNLSAWARTEKSQHE